MELTNGCADMAFVLVDALPFAPSAPEFFDRFQDPAARSPQRYNSRPGRLPRAAARSPKLSPRADAESSVRHPWRCGEYLMVSEVP